MFQVTCQTCGWTFTTNIYTAAVTATYAHADHNTNSCYHPDTFIKAVKADD